MTALATTPTHLVGEQTELARYTIPAGERVISGQRIDGTVILIDHPDSDEDGRVYLIERGLEQDGNAAMLALVADYLAVAARDQEIPAASGILTRWLQQLD